MHTMKRALVSVFDKSGVADFASTLVRQGIEVVSTGGTFHHLKENGVPVSYVSDITGFPEILDGRVKTLHPRVHGGILARRDRSEDMSQLEQEQIVPIDLVAVNLYPFSQTVSRADVTISEALEMIDIGGPTMVRAAAKNYPFVLVLVNPSRYADVAARLASGDDFDVDFRRELALEAFRHTSGYDLAICDYLEQLRFSPEEARS